MRRLLLLLLETPFLDRTVEQHLFSKPAKLIRNLTLRLPIRLIKLSSGLSVIYRTFVDGVNLTKSPD